MPGRLVTRSATLALAVAAALPPFAAQPFQPAFAACRAVQAAKARLACYDALPLPEAEATTFRGAGSGMAGPFQVTGPQMMRFHSDDAIFVAYLLDGEGQVVQNLHHGGAGEGAFLIETPGTYRVQVNASGGWRVMLSPP
ncbi:hypothetical protein SAMN04489859_101646 [Paracoccus alcaliphilus]|uniref:Uncharacterized protein n=1 Tax=Paracoccus alcaliphilus TaxID=34002 RepID=A0A1H8J9C1_9RHOB|nr:hypothetical protein SAMN04489859_101646 [Paracoccus alcaliphilus]